MPYNQSPREGKQPSMRRHSTFTDQYGREWDAAIEKETGHSTGPLSPTFNAPLKVPQEYVREIHGKDGRVFVDHARWLEDATEAHARHTQQLQSYAMAMYGAGASEKLRERPPELMAAVGQPPFPLEPIRAAIAGNKYVLGIKQPNGQPYPMPEWARKFFEKKQVDIAGLAAAEFPDVEVPGAEPEMAPAPYAVREGAFPAHTAGGRYILSNGEIVQGKEAAQAAQDALAGAVGVAVDPSWGT